MAWYGMAFLGTSSLRFRQCIASSVVTHIFLLNFASLCGIILGYYGMVWCGMAWYVAV